jgi:hypothetical protein
MLLAFFGLALVYWVFAAHLASFVQRSFDGILP